MTGFGPTVADDKPGWMLRTEMRQDHDGTEEHDEGSIRGTRIGLELWSTRERVGFSVPIGGYLGAQVARTRMTLGAGVGLWAVDHHDDRAHHGVAPFLTSSVELWRDELVISLDLRVTRQIVEDTRDFNVYSVMFMVGKVRD